MESLFLIQIIAIAIESLLQVVSEDSDAFFKHFEVIIRNLSQILLQLGLRLLFFLHCFNYFITFSRVTLIGFLVITNSICLMSFRHHIHSSFSLSLLVLELLTQSLVFEGNSRLALQFSSEEVINFRRIQLSLNLKDSFV